MRTIIQHIGPLLGEENVGSVFGQPNGSIANGQGFSPAPYSPSTGSIIWNIDYFRGNSKGVFTYLYFKKDFSTSQKYSFLFTYLGSPKTTGSPSPEGTIELLEDVADTSAYPLGQLATDEKFTNVIATISTVRGQFTSQLQFQPIITLPEISTDQTLYYRRVLLDSNGNSLNKYSNVLTFTYKGTMV